MKPSLGDRVLFGQMLEGRRGLVQAYMLRNVSPDGHRGAVIASPTRGEPDYYFNWVRDSALVMDALLRDLTRGGRALTASEIQRFTDFALFTRKIQSWLDEVKFYVDGTPFTGAWMRPQNDGPALRAVVLTAFARQLQRQGLPIPTELYAAELPAMSAIKRDLEYTARNWHKPSGDLWEEIKGLHFFTLMAQRRALVEGAALARDLGDSGAADAYINGIDENGSGTKNGLAALNATLEGFFDPEKGYVVATRAFEGGNDYGKTSNLDIAIILGALHGDAGDGFFSVTDDRIIATMHAIRERFAALYPVNSNDLQAPAIGRYPEDHWDGHARNGVAHPWVLATNAFAEAHFRMAAGFGKKGSVTLTPRNLAFFRHLLQSDALQAGQTLAAPSPELRSLLEKLEHMGDQYLLRALWHAKSDGSWSEQIDRQNGFMRGVEHLTWSYASALSAMAERDGALVPQP